MAKQLFCSFFLMAALCLEAGPMRDHGIDPNNLGKGDWISYFQYATNQFRDPNSPPDIIPITSVVDIPTALAHEKNLGMDYVIVKAGTGASHFMLGRERQFTSTLVNQAHAVGLKIFGYTRSDGKDVAGEIELAAYVFDCGADGFVIDAEAEWERSRPWIGTNGPALARKLCEGIRARFPNKFLGHSPMPVISYHSSFPYREFGLYCDAVMPQLYWRSFKKTPTETVNWMDEEWKRWHASLKGIYTNAIKPIVPVGPGGPGMPAPQVVEFMNYLKSDPYCVTTTGYRGVNFFRAGRYPLDVQRVFREIHFPEVTPAFKNFLNVKTASVTSNSATVTWTTRSPSTDAVEIGTSTNYGTVVAGATASSSHSVILTNLAGNTVYHFRFRSTAGSGPVQVSDDFLLLTLPQQIGPDIVIDNLQAIAVSNWVVAANGTDRYGKNYLHRKGNGTAYVEFATNIVDSGSYQVFEMHSGGDNRSAKAAHIMSCGRQGQTNYINQKIRGGVWNLVGAFEFTAGDRFSLRITDNPGNDRDVVVADAIKLSPYTPLPMERGSTGR
jgi:hypothetical protein